MLPSHFDFGANSLFYREQIQLVSRLFNSPHNDGDNLVQNEARLRLKALLLGLHNLNVGQSTTNRSYKNFSWASLFAWIDDNLDQTLSLPQVAAHVNIAPITLTKKFKQAHNTTLSQYLAAPPYRQGQVIAGNHHPDHLRNRLQCGHPRPPIFQQAIPQDRRYQPKSLPQREPGISE